MLYWGFSVFYAAALSETAWIRWIEWKEKKLEHQLKEYANFTWEANTPDGAFLCNLDGEKYLKSKFESEICLKSMFLQTLNTFWVIWNVVVRTIAVIPSLLVFGALLYKGLPQDGSLDTMTIGQLLDSNLLLITFYCILVVNFIIFMMKGLSGLPGYKSYKGVKLTRLLSKDYPILSNASEFNVTGHKLDPEKSEESLIAV